MVYFGILYVIPQRYVWSKDYFWTSSIPHQTAQKYQEQMPKLKVIDGLFQYTPLVQSSPQLLLI
jgi:hypothetical protein